MTQHNHSASLPRENTVTKEVAAYWQGLGIPSHITTSDLLATYWQSIGIPESIAVRVGRMATAPKGKRYAERAQRFAAFGAQSLKNADDLGKKWGVLEKFIRIKLDAEEEADKLNPCRITKEQVTVGERLFELFLSFPDAPAAQPYALLFGRRAVDPVEELSRYKEYAAACAKLEEIVNPRGRTFRNLLADAAATEGEASTLAGQYRSICSNFYHGLELLHKLLDTVDPAAKIPSSHTKAESGAQANYVIQLAELNRFLSTPRFAAIADLAAINCPSATVTKDAIRNCWNRLADKQP